MAVFYSLFPIDLPERFFVANPTTLLILKNSETEGPKLVASVSVILK